MAHPNVDNSDIKFIPNDEVAALLKDSSKVAGRDYRVIDVRDASAYAQGHLPTAVNVVKTEFATDATPVVEQHQHIPRLIFHCGHSQNSGPKAARAYIKAAEATGKTGQDVVVMAGGFGEWKEKELDIVQ
ncbi:hypothetical protein HDV00_000853 [Rhizophlyctis rosea]|nr:hypothetical protein HDV00_000853 [Rhizophlyctis rosea]